MNFVAGTDWLAVQLHLFAVALGGGLLLGGCWQAYGLLFRPLRRARRNWLGPDAVFALLMLGLLLLWWFSLTDGSLRAADFLWLGLGLSISLALPWPQPRRRYGSGVLKSTRAKVQARAKRKATGKDSKPETAARDGATAAVSGPSIAGGPALVMATRAALAVAMRARSISERRRQRRQERREAQGLSENRDEKGE